jgi:5-methyltetrahydropteroyltriglutamate--homocysteine methyltransferase
MKIQTTTIGSYPKPDFVPTPDYFRQESLNQAGFTEAYDEFIESPPEDLEDLYVRGAAQVINDQVDAGIDIPTDGEIRRDSYIHYHCRHLHGIDFSDLTNKVMRDGSWEIPVPTITAPIKPGKHFLIQDWLAGQNSTPQPVKVTIPGPLTIIDSTFDAHYGDERALAYDLAEAINFEIKGLAEAGCQWIQVDEPLFARHPDKALDYGVEALDRCFHGVDEAVTRTMHMCCGYPDLLDNENYHKADRETYFRLAPALDESSIQVVSIEDAHRYNDLSLLELFANTRIILGVVAIARTRIEPVEEIRDRLTEALNHIEPGRLLAGPDCGLGMLSREQAVQKMGHLSRAAHSV